MLNEGVIKFELRHRLVPLAATPAAAIASRLSGWRKILRATSMIGQTPDRYDGAGYGNVSARPDGKFAPPGQRSFLITGTQTSGVERLSLEQYAWIDSYDYRRNTVDSHGAVQPSSEAMTHGAVYDLEARIEAVLHAHSPEIWCHAEALGLPTTDPSAAYGTPDMAFEVRRLYHLHGLRKTQLFVMSGHEDGVVAFGPSVDAAGSVLMTWLARALRLHG